MDKLTFLAHSLRAVLAGLRATGVRPPATWSDAAVAGNAQALSYSILASWWQRWSRAPSWQWVYDQWDGRLPEARTIDEEFYGYLQPGDRFELLTRNAESFEKRQHLYESASRSIDLSTFYIESDETGWRTAQALADQARRGVRVRIVADRCCTNRKIFENPKANDVIRYLRESGVDYRLFSDSDRPYDACHRKLLIVDGTTLVTGGRNYANSYAGAEWRDIDLLLSGPSVARIQPFFEETFASFAIPRKGAAKGNIFQPAEPAEVAANAYFLYFLQCIRACRKTLDIENDCYFNHPILHRHVADACRRGVRVRLFTNSAASNYLPHRNYRLYSGFPALLDAGVMLYLRRGAGRNLHCKYFVADGQWVGFGGSSLDFYSPRFCLELGIHIRDARLGQALTFWFEQGIEEADQMTNPRQADQIVSRETIGRMFDRWYKDIQ